MKIFKVLFVLMIISVFGTHQIVAQDGDKKAVSNSEKEVIQEDVAKRDIDQLNQALDLTLEQKESLNVLFVEIAEKKVSIATNEKDAAKRKLAYKEVEIAKDRRLKQILTEEQYEKYLKTL